MDPAVSLNLNTTLGAFQIGVLVSYVLFGVTTTQTYIYYSRFPDDSLKLKVLVAFVWICEVGHALCIGHSLYVYTISDYAHPERVLGPAPKSLETTSIFSGVIGACVGVARHLRLERQHYERFDDLGNAGGPPPQSSQQSAHENRGARGKTHFVEHRDWDIDKFVAMKDNFIWIAFWVIGARGEGVSRNMALSCNFNHISLKVFSNSLLASVQTTKVSRIVSSAEPSHVQSDKVLPEDV
ncbi:hypothetical protein B0H13DRAFT_2560281 [Mycena leptocephala]|nr:hypothetical protein B0H13DRAFT_2560281 [Mycena leptocephala]